MILTNELHYEFFLIVYGLNTPDLLIYTENGADKIHYEVYF